MARKQSEQAVSELYRTWGLEPAQRPDGTAADQRELVEVCAGALSSQPSGDFLSASIYIRRWLLAHPA